MAKMEPENFGLAPELPRHVGVIMDGNGRWAQKRGLPRPLGHRAAMERLRDMIRLSSDLGMEALSLYAFSTENWKRPQSEIDALMGLFMEYFLRELDELHANGVCIRILGDKDAFPARIRASMVVAEEKTAHNQGLKLNIALNYGSRAEVVRAVNLLLASGKPADEQMLMNALYTAGLPDLDLVIRTGGERRLSNFLLLQAAYAELVFVEDYFPDFTQARYVDCIREYQRRSRRFGDVP
ncbi:MAG: polyprenyl diphosphate synthase [Candidatus Pelethousia sp.]|nr:polyprenyl diphosphate synthase [Candidatus Pelethousia sp.]